MSLLLQVPSSSSSSSSSASSVFGAGPSFIPQKAANFSSISFNTKLHHSQFSAIASSFSRLSLLRHVASPICLRSTPSFFCFASGKRNPPRLVSLSLCLSSLFPLVSLFFIDSLCFRCFPMFSLFFLYQFPFFYVMWILCLLKESVSLRDFPSIRSCTWTILYQYSVPVFYFIFTAFPIIEIFYSYIFLVFILSVLHSWMLVLLLFIVLCHINRCVVLIVRLTHSHMRVYSFCSQIYGFLHMHMNRCLYSSSSFTH